METLCRRWSDGLRHDAHLTLTLALTLTLTLTDGQTGSGKTHTLFSGLLPEEGADGEFPPGEFGSGLERLVVRVRLLPEEGAGDELPPGESGSGSGFGLG